MINSLTSNAAYSKYGFDNKEIERSMGITEPETPATPEEKPAPEETPATKEKPEITEESKIVPEANDLRKEAENIRNNREYKKEKELEDNANAAKQNRENLENEIEKANKQKEELEENAKAAKENRENANTNLENVASVETVVLLSQQKADDYLEVEIDLDELDATSAETKTTYEEIKKYVAEHNDGMKVSNLYIAQVKKKCGIELGQNFNLPKSENAKQPQCPKEKEDAIVEALKAFQMI